MNPFNAAAALMSRLSYAQKFLLLGLVLLAPSGYALHAYWAVQGDTLAFAESERAGVAFVAPANEVAVRVVSARGVAVRQRMVRHLDGEAFLGRVQRRSLRHGPRAQHTVDLQPEVVVQRPRLVELDDESRHLAA